MIQGAIVPSIGVNTAFAALTNLLGVRLDPYPACNFLVEIDGILAGGFSECSGLEAETEMVEYREGGLNQYAHQFAGPCRYPPLVLKHGITLINGLYSLGDWHHDVVRGKIVRKNGTIYLLDRRQIPVLWWNIKKAIPVKWTGPELRAESSTIAIESVELVHQGLERPGLASLLLGGISSAISG
jgi:phage tail-like protein